MAEHIQDVMVEALRLAFLKAAAQAARATGEHVAVERAFLRAAVAFSDLKGDPVLIAQAASLGEDPPASPDN